jgi:hypothetical protein
MGVCDRGGIAALTISSAEPALEAMHHSWFGAVTSANGCEYGVVLRLLRTGFVSPERQSISPIVLEAGHTTFGFMRSKRAFSFRAPQDGKRLRKASISFTSSSGVAWEQL